jgi:hypothetical protein
VSRLASTADRLLDVYAAVVRDQQTAPAADPAGEWAAAAEYLRGLAVLLKQLDHFRWTADRLEAPGLGNVLRRLWG